MESPAKTPQPHRCPDRARRPSNSPRPKRAEGSRSSSLAQQIRRASCAAEAEELAQQRQKLQEELRAAKLLMAQQQKQQAQDLEDFAAMRGNLDRACAEVREACASAQEAKSAAQEHAELLASCREVVAECEEGQQTLAEQLLQKSLGSSARAGQSLQRDVQQIGERLKELGRRPSAAFAARSLAAVWSGGDLCRAHVEPPWERELAQYRQALTGQQSELQDQRSDP
ncbi:unnamed protein product [Effrenium voratum]|nr:unnamed protein product [Effrenium voratum]